MQPTSRERRLVTDGELHMSIYDSLGGADGVVEPPGLRVRGRQEIEVLRPTKPVGPADPLGQPHGFRAVPDRGISVRGQDPRDGPRHREPLRL